MKISLKAIAIATGVLWGGAILFVGMVNLASPSYGLSFRQVVSSAYPGFHAYRAIGEQCAEALNGIRYNFGTIKGEISGERIRKRRSAKHFDFLPPLLEGSCSRGAGQQAARSYLGHSLRPISLLCYALVLRDTSTVEFSLLRKYPQGVLDKI
jgi:hypothetical protein